MYWPTKMCKFTHWICYQSYINSELISKQGRENFRKKKEWKKMKTIKRNQMGESEKEEAEQHK